MSNRFGIPLACVGILTLGILTTACANSHPQLSPRTSASMTSRARATARSPEPEVDAIDRAQEPPLPTAQDVISMRIHHVTLEFLDGLRLRYPTASVQNAISLRIHGVTLDALDALRYAYPMVSIDQAVAMRIHGVTPTFVGEILRRDATATIDEAVSMRIHHVTLEFVDQLQARDPSATIADAISANSSRAVGIPRRGSATIAVTTAPVT